MRWAATTVSLTLFCLALLAAAALGATPGDQPEAGHDGGEGWYGETNDKAITNAGFLIIAFVPLFVLMMSLIQHALDKRKDARKASDKARKARADARGGW